jgi:signal transduction histidine kinase
VTELAADLGELQDLARQVLDGIRQRSRALHPVVLDDFGLEHALRSHVEVVSRQVGIPIEARTTGDFTALPGDTATHLYRVLQEALTNVVRHAGASEIAVTATRDAHGVELTIDDDGRGIASDAAPAPGLGLTSMRERAAIMGGTFAIGVSPLGGTRVTVRVPAQT